MKFKINRKHFSSALGQVSNIVGTRSTIPILGNVLINAQDGTVSLTTSNLDVAIRLFIKAEVLAPGVITLPVKRLAAIVPSLPSEEVTVEICGDNRVKVASGSSTFQLHGIAAGEFPPLSQLANQCSFSLEQGVLSKLLRKVAYAQSTDENRYTLNGVFFNFAEQNLTLVATDGRRLATAAHPLEVGAQGGSIILPAKTVAELQRILADGGNGEVKVEFNEKQVSFIVQVTKDDKGLVDNVQLVSKVVEGTFPNFRQVIPKETVNRVELERQLMFDALKRAQLVVSDKSTSVKVTFAENSLDISASSSEFGEANDKLAIAYEGEPVKIAFNPKYLMDPLEALVDDKIYFEFKDEMSPGVVKNSEDFCCVVMPQRSSQ
ncbi:MAG: DNA polymerase III subunit beta [Puniceicoccales bacterium]|jgi:DNA polymerase-3 subunit beta|nr:DNA polymerase III subunit beta [Puniceicoccales bacterium]